MGRRLRRSSEGLLADDPDSSDRIVYGPVLGEATQTEPRLHRPLIFLGAFEPQENQVARRDGMLHPEVQYESMKHRPSTGNWCVGRRQKDPSHVYERAGVRYLRSQFRNRRWRG